MRQSKFMVTTLMAALAIAGSRPLTAQDADKTNTKSNFDQGIDAINSYNPELARKKFTDSCNTDREAAGCYNLGTLHMSGKGGPKDDAAARSVFIKSCELGNAVGCYNAGIFLTDGRGGITDTKFAKELFQKSCDLGKKETCQLAVVQAPWTVKAPAAASDRRGVAADRDRSCVDKYNRTVARFGKGMTDAQIDWAFAYEKAAREGLPCPPNFPGAPAIQAPTSSQPPAPSITVSGEEWCLNGHRHYIKENGSVRYTSACHDHD